MPEDERPPPAPHLSGDEWHLLLATGEVEIEGRMPWSSNATFLVTLHAGALRAPAVYKPAAGERRLWDFPAGLFRREVAASLLAAATELVAVPETVARAGPFGEGSFQRFIEADFSEHYFSLRDGGHHDEALRRLCAFDLLANNADRKGGHVLVDGAGRIWGIDHGLCFHAEDKLRTVCWDFAGEPLPDAALAACASLAAGLPGELAALLAPRERRALVARARRLLERPVFPHPDPDERCYPWPLV